MKKARITRRGDSYIVEFNSFGCLWLGKCLCSASSYYELPCIYDSFDEAKDALDSYISRLTQVVIYERKI
jgi:hypothetical protein